MTLSAGSRFGAYEILGTIGAGGMGVVYRALDTRLKRETALKLLPDVADGDDSARARLMHEARAAAALNHPNICTIHEVGDVDGVPYIAMEFIGGETLQSMLRRQPMPPERVCRIGHQLADALEHAHAHGIIHRDFKAANVMITADGRPKVLDFGIALQLRSPEEATPVQVTTDVGVEQFAAWSPDGRTLAYSSNPSGAAVANSDVWVTQVGGGSPINRTADYAGLDEFPSWSPDGRQIAFWSSRDGGGCYVMPALSGSARKVATAAQRDQNQPQWSSDGRTLSCVGSTGADVFIDIVSLDNGVSQRQLALPGDGRRMFISRSRDEQMYALVSGFNLRADVTQLWVLHVPSNRSFAVTDGRTRVMSPSWSPDGRWLYYVSNAGDSMDLWRQGISGEGAVTGPPQPISAGIGMRDAAVSSDGARVVYSQGRWLSNAWRVPILPARPATWADATQLTFDHAFIEFLDVSRDGTRLAVSSDRSGNQDLWTLPTEGGEMQRLTTDPTPEWAPRWSPDQSTLAFYAYRTGEREIYTMPASGGPWKQITNGSGPNLAPSWSWDGSKIASYGGVGGILISPVNGGPAHLMSNAQAGGPEFSPIDDRLLYGALGSAWIVPVSEATPPVKIADEGSGNMSWAPDGKSLVSVVTRNGARMLVSIADDGTHERRLTNLTGRRGALGGDLKTNGKFLYFTWYEDVGDLWVMDIVQAGK